MSKTVIVFGKNGCAKCESTKRKIDHLLGKRGLAESVTLYFHDMNTPEGMAEAAFVDVGQVPTTVVNVDGVDRARWEGEVPKSDEVLSALNEVN